MKEELTNESSLFVKSICWIIYNTTKKIK